MSLIIKNKKIPGVGLKRFSLANITIVFIGFVCVCLVGLLFLHLVEAKRYELKVAESASANVTRAMAQQAEDTFDEADLVLEALIDSLGANNYDAQQQLRLHDVLARRAQALAQVHGFFFFDAEGHSVVSSFGEKFPEATVADRAYFKYHQNSNSLAPLISAAIRSRENGDWVIPFSRRVNDAQGHFKGVVLAAIKMQYFDDFFRGFNIDADGAMLIALSDGTLLVRRPSVERYIGMSIADGEIFHDYLSHSSSGNARITSKLDGQVRLFAYKRLGKYELVVAGANSEKSALNEWYNTAVRTSLITGGVIAVIGLFGCLLLIQVRKGVQVEQSLREAKGKLQLQATHDSLTGLANRRLFELSFSLEIKRCARYKRPISLVMIDIDFFKTYNDLYGHVAGDQCLSIVAEIIRLCSQRTSDLAVRYGGEEFCLLLPETDATGAFAIAERLRLGIIERAIPHTGNPLGTLTISLGCHTFIPEGNEASSDIIAKADTALYQAKNAGRNTTQVFADMA